MKILSFLLTLFFPLLANAANSDIETLINSNITSSLSLTPDSSDVSMNYLGYIFGNVDGALYGAGSQIFGAMFSVYNLAILSLGGIILLYTLIVSTLNTAHEGEVMGKKWSSIWIPLRSAIGVGLLVPKASGYSVIQIFMMWVIVQGVGAANSVWKAAINYLDMGGVIAVRQTTSTETNTYSYYNIDLANKLLARLVCVAMVEDKLNEKRLNNITLLEAAGQPTTDLQIPYTLFSDLIANYSKQINNYISTATTDVKLPTDQYIEISLPMINGYIGSCGKLKIPMNTVRSTSDNIANRALNYIAPVIAVGQMTFELLPVAKQTYNYIKNNPNQTNLNSLLGTEVLRTAAANYAHLIEPAANADNTSILIQTEMAKMKNDGWLMAGSYFSVLTRANISSASGNTIAPPTFTAETSIPTDFISADEVNKYIGGNSALSNYILANGKLLTDKSNESRRATSIPTASLLAALVPTKGSSTSDSIIKGLNSTIGSLLDEINSIFDSTNNIPPLVKIGSIGTGIIFATELMVIVIVSIIIGSTIALSAVPFMSLGVIGSVITSWITPVLIPIAFTLWSFGSILAFYIPMIPYLMFTFVSLGWFFSVIEAMIAAPLIALGIVHPEGHEAFGKAEPSLLMTINVFLKPTLIIFGFIAGILLSYVALWLLNKGFSYVYITSLFTPGKILTSFMVWILAFILFLSIYTTTALLIVQKCFDLIHLVPNRVLHWIGGHDNDPGLAAAVGEIKQQAQAPMGHIQSGTEKGQHAASGSISNQQQKANKQGEANIREGESSSDKQATSTQSGSSSGGGSGGDNSGGGGGGGSSGGGNNTNTPSEVIESSRE
ncbi:MAG: hypothetical protein LEGION0398_MBIBDBAK_00306 [Legionellaceae bacterium]